MSFFRALGASFLIFAALSATTGSAFAAVEYKKAQPLVDVINTQASPVSTRGKVRVPLITWGGDVASLHALEKGLFKAQGLDVEVFLENNFPKQVEAVLAGKTPYLRGTMGMINAAAEVFERRGVPLVVIYQLTWSTGGDAWWCAPASSRPRGSRARPSRCSSTVRTWTTRPIS